MILNAWFNPETIKMVQQTKHSLECGLVGGDEWRPLLEYDLIDQDYILRCPHKSHDSVKFIFTHFMDTPSSEKITEGRLF